MGLIPHRLNRNVDPIWVTRSAVVLCLVQPFEENHASLLPVAHDGTQRSSALRGDVFEGETAELLEVHNPGKTRLADGEFVECVR